MSFWFLLTVGLIWVALTTLWCWLCLVWAFRLGFRAAIDFLDGRRPLPRIIISWRGALRDRSNETEQ